MRRFIGLVALAALAMSAASAAGTPSATRTDALEVTGLKVAKGDLSAAPGDRDRVQVVLSLRDRLDPGRRHWAGICVEVRDPSDGGLLLRRRAVRLHPSADGGRSKVRLIATRAASRKLRVGDRVRARVRYRVAADRAPEVRCPGETGKRAHMGEGPAAAAAAAAATVEAEAMVDGGLTPDVAYTQAGMLGWQMNSTPQGSLYGGLVYFWPDFSLETWGTPLTTLIPIGIPVQIIQMGEADAAPAWGGTASETSTLTAELVPGTKNVAVTVGDAGWCVLLSPDGDGLDPGQPCP